MPEFTITIHHEAGLHARPLAVFVKTANQFEADIEVTNLSNEKGPSNGKSPLKLLLLATQQGHEIKVRADGEQAEEALAALKTLIESNFEG